jgi:hypothetical protein
MPNPNANNFYNPNDNFNSEFMQNNNISNFIPNNLPLNNYNNNHNPENFPYFINQKPNNFLMFLNNDNLNTFNPNQNLQNFSNFDLSSQPQMFNNNVIKNITNNSKTEPYESYKIKENIRIPDNGKRDFNSKENISNKENTFLNRKRESDVLVEFVDNKTKKYTGTGAKNLEYIKIGDWICRRCDNINFSYRTKCHRCKSFFEDLGENINGNEIN